MNYFNYFTEVENEFVKRRGSHMLVSPLDWSLIENWKQRGVPLHIVLRGINSSFDGYDKRAQRGRKVNTLFFCQQEIEALYLQYREARVGSNELATNGTNANQDQHDTNNASTAEAAPAAFAPARVIEYLSEHRETLEILSKESAHDWPLAETFTRTATRLQQLVDEIRTTRQLDSEALERDLTIIEELILDALKQSTLPATLAEYEADAKQRLRTYRDKMNPEVYEQTLSNYLGRRLREHFRVPRLSLFYF